MMLLSRCDVQRARCLEAYTYYFLGAVSDELQGLFGLFVS